ncbi:MAG: response regulator, partial [Solirubrobacteraceae bacterium]|nr:response regulator [Solirubrobacteraceae bacterium]
EDNPTEAELAKRTHNKNNLANNQVWVNDGAEALDFLFARGEYAGRSGCAPPRVVLLDLRLPKVDGLEVLRAVKTDPRTKEIPIVVLTSSKEDRDITESYQLGVNSYISKPVEFEAFAKTVTELGMYWLLVNHAPVAES